MDKVRLLSTPPPLRSFCSYVLKFLFPFYQWKAAKEELHEEVEEPEDAYEILEKKRHREIEV